MSGNNQLQIIDKYWYLGLIFTEFLSYDDMAKSVAQSATRALGLVIAKCKVVEVCLLMYLHSYMMLLCNPLSTMVPL